MNITDTLTLVMTSIFLVFILSYYVLLFWKVKKPKYEKSFSSITILVPARNEEKHLQACIDSIIAADFTGKKDIIIIDDASLDATKKVAQRNVKKHGALLLSNKKHLGKAFSLNKALKKATGDLVAIVDADSEIAQDALVTLANDISCKNVAGGAAVVKVKNKNKFINAWVHIELMYNSLIRAILSKAKANVVTPGPLSMYRRSALEEIGGFNTQGYNEDMDIAIRLIRKGYHITSSNTSIAETNMPEDIKSFFRQRIRMAKGMVFLLKKNVQVNTSIIDIYTLPLLLFTYIQAVIMGAITIFKLASGYYEYFFSQGVMMSLGVVKFFFEWFSVVGFFKWTYAILVGMEPLTFLSLVGIASTLLSYPLIIYSIIAYEKRIRLSHIIPFVFMFPYWLLLMIIYASNLPEFFKKEQYNRWKKNEK